MSQDRKYEGLDAYIKFILIIENGVYVNLDMRKYIKELQMI